MKYKIESFQMKILFIKIITIFITLLISGCSMSFSKDHKISTPLNTPFAYSYDHPVRSNPCISGTENYQKCLNNSDLNPSMTGKY